MRRLVMKKIYLTLVLTLSLSLNVLAQTDGFFKMDNEDIYNRLDDPTSVGLNLPHNPIGDPNNAPAPLGNGLLILTAVGLGYAIRKRKK